MTTFVDPVSQPNDYQQMLLTLVGDQDPAEVQTRTPPLLRSLVAAAGTDVRTRPEP